jgi:hypothetical protein
MGYWEQSQLSQDRDFLMRVAACATVEFEDVDGQVWAETNIWEVAAAPGFADAYASAIAGSVPYPGRDPSVISDAQILGAVQSMGPAP